jgi:hypothetical protein
MNHNAANLLEQLMQSTYFIYIQLQNTGYSLLNKANKYGNNHLTK